MFIRSRKASLFLLVFALAATTTSAMAVTKSKSTKKTTSEQKVAVNSGEAASIPVISLRETSSNRASSKLFQFDIKQRWGLKFDVNQPVTKPAGLNDIDAGAYFKLSPSVSVGGSVGFGEKTKTLQPKAEEPKNQQARVRLETQFKF